MNEELSNLKNQILNELRLLDFNTRDIVKSLTVESQKLDISREEKAAEEAVQVPTTPRTAEGIEPPRKKEESRKSSIPVGDILTTVGLTGLAAFPDLGQIVGDFYKEQTEKTEAPTPISSGASKISQPAAVTQESSAEKLSTPAAAPSMTVKYDKGTSREAVDFFVRQGFTPEQSAGIVGNLVAESNLDPGAFNKIGGGQGARGIAQWRGPRIEDFKKVIGKDPLEASFEEQLQFVAWELNNTEKTAKNQLLKAESAEEAAVLFDKFYERSGGSAVQKRVALANSIISQYTPAVMVESEVATRDLAVVKKPAKGGTTIIDASKNNVIVNQQSQASAEIRTTRDAVYKQYLSYA